MKANDHPAVRDLRRYLDKHNLHGAVMVAVTNDGQAFVVSAGKDVKSCNALGPLLRSNSADELLIDIDMALEKVRA